MGKCYFNIFHKPLSYSKLRAKIKHQGGNTTFDVRQVPTDLITLNKCDILIKHMEDFVLFQDDDIFSLPVFSCGFTKCTNLKYYNLAFLKLYLHQELKGSVKLRIFLNI